MTRIHPVISAAASWMLAAGLVVSLAGCGNTARGVVRDTGNVADAVAGAANTVDVKSALIADDRIDTANINVDTDNDANTVVLKGTVPTAEQRRLAEQVASQHAKGYKIVNQLTVAAAK